MTPAEAVALQRQLAAAVETADRFGSLDRVAGVDVGFEDGGRITRAAVAVLDAATLVLTDWAIARRPTAFPYIPGLLSFRELPAILDALPCLRRLSDILLVDGQGLAHPRRCGLACHLGLETGLPAIGVAKTRLIGEESVPGPARGDWSPLLDKGETVGAILRTRTGVAPLYVSIGHRVSLGSALRITLACTGRYRLPETTRAAHRLASGPAPAGQSPNS